MGATGEKQNRICLAKIASIPDMRIEVHGRATQGISPNLTRGSTSFPNIEPSMGAETPEPRIGILPQHQIIRGGWDSRGAVGGRPLEHVRLKRLRHTVEEIVTVIGGLSM